MRKIFFFLCFVTMFNIGFGQSPRFGFSTGLSFSNLKTESLEANESLNFSSGFVFGVTAHIPIIDVFGIKTGLNYIQRGTEQRIEGNSFFRMENDLGIVAILEGTRSQKLVIKNSYLTLPISVYADFFETFQIYGGIDVGFLVASNADGGLDFRDNSLNGVLNTTLRYNFKSDKARGFSGQQTDVVDIKGRPYAWYNQIGAYYEYPEKTANLFNSLEFSGHVGLSYFITPGLYFTGKASLGFVDVTDEGADRSYTDRNGANLVFRNDRDVNLSFDFMLGFRF